MFFFRHPGLVVDGRTHAVQVVQQKRTQEMSRAVLVVDAPAESALVPDAPDNNGPAPRPMDPGLSPQGQHRL